MELLVLLGILTMLIVWMAAVVKSLFYVIAEVTEAVTSESELTESEVEDKEETNFTSSENILTEQENPCNEYTEVPAPEEGTGANNSHATGVTISVSVALFLVVAAIAILRRSYRTSKVELLCEPCTATVTPLAEYESAFSGNVESYLNRVGFRLQNRMTQADKATFRRVEICAQAFDSMNLGKSETLGRIHAIYMPALTDITERIAAAPTQAVVESLMPYFHRHCDVLREAMEYELSQYQKRATMEAEAEITAVEKFSSLKHDTDDNAAISLTL